MAAVPSIGFYPVGDRKTPPTILIVDDQPDSQVLLSTYLRKDGYKVEIVGDAMAALTLVEGRPPDLILLDVIMPAMDGFEVCRYLKSREQTMFIPVILVTALTNRRDRVKGIEAGADEFLSKPVYREEVLARVRSLLRWQKARQALEEERIARVRDTFKRYVSPALVHKILAHPEEAGGVLQDQCARRRVVILFADIRGFTRLAESLAPQVVVGVLNTYFSTLTKIAHHYEGTIFNMAGDSLLVGFNVPFEQPDASVRALSTGIDMIAHFSELAEQWQRQHNIAVGLGVGVDQGDVVVGNVGSSAYMNYTVIGDAVNVAARLVQLAAPGELLLSERLRPALGGLYPGLSLSLREDFVQIKGKIAPQRVFRIRPGSNL